MKVFACRNQESYGGGLILAAANTKEEAYRAASVDEDINYFLEDTYPLDKWFEVKHLSTDLAESKVIIEDHYTE